MKRILKLLVFISIFITVIFIAVLSTAYFERDSRLKLVCSPFTERKGFYARSCVPNPFRDKMPEQMAESLLQSLKNNQIDAALPYLQIISKEPEKYIGKEKDTLSVSSWIITNREIEKDGRYRLTYSCKREDFSNAAGIVFFFNKDQGDWVLNEISIYP